jgi:hypothetical protein
VRRGSKHEVESLLWEMEQLEFEANKIDILSYTSERELDAYESLNKEIGGHACFSKVRSTPVLMHCCPDASITKVSKEIEELHTKVQVEKTIRAYKEEYESISRVINELPSRQDLSVYVDNGGRGRDVS